LRSPSRVVNQVELGKHHPSIDWSDIKERDGKRRVNRTVKIA
jgi:hypothetical protein